MCLDYNEPQKGKDQCDQEAVVARNALWNYVDQGNNIQSTHDIFIALASTKLWSTKVSFIEFDKTIMLLKGKKMAGIDKYSYQFTQQGMKVWWYCQIGAGLVIPFDPDFSFKPGVQVIQSFVPPQDNVISSTRNAKRKYWQINNLFFCCNRNCTQSLTLEELEDHMMNGIHEIPVVKSGMDLVKKSFSKRMIEAATSHKSLTSTPS